MKERRRIDHPIAEQFAAFWASRRRDIRAVLERAEQLARAMPDRLGAFVLCHSDLHAGNVLVGAAGQLTIVDWDNPVFARKERDLMFVGAVWAAYGPIPARPNGSSADGPADIDLPRLLSIGKSGWSSTSPNTDEGYSTPKAARRIANPVYES